VTILFNKGETNVAKTIEDKETLCIVPSAEEGDSGSWHIYKDGTFRYTEWSPDDFSKWKLYKAPNGEYQFHYKHAGQSDWSYDGDSDIDDQAIIDAILVERAMEKILK
jgi:hypothetical protein